MLALADCNNFFVSCERVADPRLQGKPVIVLSNNDGAVVSRSQEAKALGIKMTQPFFQIESFCKAHGVRVISGNMELYSSISSQVMEVIEEFAPGCEVYSIDEAFMDWSMFVGRLNLEEHAAGLRALVKEKVGIPISIGVAPTKALAKLANDYAKNHTTTGVCELTELSKQEEILKILEVGDIWGVGHRSAHKLTARRIKTCWDFRQAPKPIIKSLMGIHGERLQLELQGLKCFQLNEHAEPAKSIQSTRSFGKAVLELEGLKEAVATFTARAAEKLRRENQVAKRIGVYIRTSRFNTQRAYYSNYQDTVLTSATSDTATLTKTAVSLLETIFQSGHHYKKAGIILGDLTPRELLNGELFESVKETKTDERRLRLMGIYDNLVSRWGRDKVFFASMGTNQTWKGRRKHLGMPIMNAKTENKKAPHIKFVNGA